jgi:predicted GNAT family N-acyltransferase
VCRLMNTKVTSYEESGADIRAVRDRVFVQEQGIPQELEWDGDDPCCIHVVVSDSGENAIGTGRMQPDGRIGRLAVLEPWRGQGIGTKLLDALIEVAGRQGLEMVYLHAQLHAIPFYEKNGFEQDGREFVEDGIRHVNMKRATQPPLTAHHDGAMFSTH